MALLHSMDVRAGLSYQLSEIDATAALIGCARSTLAEAIDPDGDDYAYGRTLSVGLTTYRVINPFVLMLTGGINFQRMFVDKIDGAGFGTDRTCAGMEFGVRHGESRDLALRAITRAEMTATEG